MPELPEVEVTRRGIAAALAGATVTGVRLGKPLRWPLGASAAAIVGRTVGAVGRRGKYLWLPLHDGAPPEPADPDPDPAAPPDAHSPGLLVHLGMSGSLHWWPQPPAAPDAGPHDHLDLLTDRGTLRLNDPRRFGAVLWSSALAAEPAAKLLRGLGAEPFDAALTPAAFHAALGKRRAPIKNVLLAGDVVVGAGNIYACEALFRAGIAPTAVAARIGPARAARLLRAVQDTLAEALALGGSTLRDFSDVHGASGLYQSMAAVYGREGEPCPRCARPVRRRVQQQRSTYWCAHCQRP